MKRVSIRDSNEGVTSPFTTHQTSDGGGFTPAEASKPCRNGTSTEFSRVSGGTDGDGVSPGDPVVK